MTADSTLFALYVIAIEAVIATFILAVAPRVTERRVVPRVLDLFEHELLPQLKQEAMDAAEHRIAQAQAQLEAQAEAMQHAAIDGAEKRIEASKVELRDMMKELGAQMAQAALAQADQRIEAARSQLEAQMAGAGAHDGEARTAGEELAAKSVASRQEFAMQEEVFEATIRQLQPALAPVLITTAKTMLPKVWKQSVRAGPESLPGLYERLRAFMPGLGGQQAQSQRASWS